MGLSEFEIDRIYQIFNVLPIAWKHLLGKNQGVEDTKLEIHFVLNCRECKLNDISSRAIYSALMMKKNEKLVNHNNSLQPYTLSEKEIALTYLRSRKSTLDSRLREFQYKMLYNLIYTRKHLYQFGIVDDKSCLLCNNYDESYEHLFYSCIQIKQLWKSCGDVFHLPLLCNLDWQDIHIGIKITNFGEKQLVNHLILLIKYMVFKYSREKNRVPSVVEIKETMLESKEEERKIASERGTLSLHFRKWDSFK